MAVITSKISLEGDRELLARLQALDPALSRRVLADSCRKAMDPVLAEAQRRVRVKSGNLKASLTIRQHTWKRKRKADAYVTMGRTVTGSKGRNEYPYYMTPLERGAKPHRIRTPWPTFSGKLNTVKHPGHRPFPFLRPAYSLNWRKAVESIRKDVKAYVEAAWNAAGKLAGSSGKDSPTGAAGLPSSDVDNTIKKGF